jgi:adenylate kinase
MHTVESSTISEMNKWGAIKLWLGAGAINVFGRPLAGKDTQAEAIAKQLGGRTLSGGQILRSGADPDVLRQIDSGVLLTQEQYLRIITPCLSLPEYTGTPLILSSVGRWDGEQQTIMQATTDSGHPLRAVIHLELSDAQSVARLEAIKAQGHGERGSRADDHHAALEIRLREYDTKTIPVIQWYEHQGLLVPVDASQPSDIVTQHICNELFKLATASPQ